jgi:chromosome segregation ATPase
VTLSLGIIVVAEESGTPSGESGGGADTQPQALDPEGRPRRSEGDLLAERRARRAAESGKDALIRRAEVAEATMQTLQDHVRSLQHRLREVEDERRRTSELLEAERASIVSEQTMTPPAQRAMIEHELRRARQREYAEQRLRVEAEERLLDLERSSRSEIDRLTRRVNASERDAHELARRLEGAERELAEVEQAAAGERAAVLRAERELTLRLAELERRSLEIRRGLDDERAARERSERLLARMSRAHRRMLGLLEESRDLVARLSTAFATGAVGGSAARSSGELAAPEEPRPQASFRAGPATGTRSAGEQPPGEDMADALAAAVERLRARVPEQPPESSRPRPAHKHSMSLIARWRAAHRRRRGR